MDRAVTFCPNGRQILRYLFPLSSGSDLGARFMYVVPSLQLACSQLIRKLIGIYSFPQINSLPLPPVIRSALSDLCLSDFHIDPSRITAQHHRSNVFPATCLIDGSLVHLTLHEREESIRRDPTLITVFHCSGVMFGVYHPITSLHSIITKCAKTGVSFDEIYIWRIINELCDVAKSVPPTTTLYPQHLHLSQGLLQYKVPNTPQSNVAASNLNNESSTYTFAVDAFGQAHVVAIETGAPATDSSYEAPELLAKQLPTEKAHVWTIGCIIENLILLRRADCQIHDVQSEDEQMSGAIEEFNSINLDANNSRSLAPGARYSRDLCALVKHCLSANPSERIALSDIQRQSHSVIDTAQQQPH